MSISHADAQQALNDVEKAQARSTLAQAYHASSAILLVWGGVWAVAYTMCGLVQPHDIWKVWALALPIGAALTFITRHKRAGAESISKWRTVALYFAIAGFIFASYAVMRPHSGTQFTVFPALVIAFMYMVGGAFRLPRLFWIGAALLLLTLTGYFFLKSYLLFWMAAVGGGALVLGGFWMRRA